MSGPGAVPAPTSWSSCSAPRATYSTAPFEPAFEGLAAIRDMWEREREGPDEVFTMNSRIVAVEGDTGVVSVEVRYGEPLRQLYRDLWVVRLDDGRPLHGVRGVAVLAAADRRHGSRRSLLARRLTRARDSARSFEPPPESPR